MGRVVSWLTEVSYRRAGLVLFVVVVVLGLGALTATRIKQELIPDIEFPVVVVIVPQAGAQPDEIVRTALAPIESSTEAIDGLQSTQSTAVAGLGVVVLEFDFGVSLEKTEGAVRQAVADTQLPAGAEPEFLLFDPSILPIVEFTLKGDASQSELLSVAQSSIVPQLRQLDGVGGVDVVGGALEQIVITLNRTELIRRGLTYDSVASDLAANNVLLPSGQLRTDAATLPLETVALYRSVDDIRNLALSAPGGQVRLRDIASVEQMEAPATGVNRTDGVPSVTVRVNKTKDANTVDTSHRVEDALNEIQPTLPAGFSVDIGVGQADFIEESVSGVVTEGLIGGVLAVIIIFLFLSNWRTTLITAVSIPLSILAAIVVLDQAGHTLNLMTLGGLTIAIGRVIDDSIVVLENVYRHMVAGERGFAAIVNGAREVTIAIIGATLTTTAVFLPLGLVGGLIGQLFLPFALAVVFALFASLLVAVTVIPALARFALADRVQSKPDRTPADTVIGKAYTPLLRWALANRWKTLGVAALLFVGSLALVPQLPIVFLPDTGEKIITVNVDAQPGQSQDAVLAQAIDVEALIQQLDPVEVQTVITGASSDFGAVGNIITGRNANSATISVELPDDGPSKNDAAEQLRELIASQLPGVTNVSVSATGGAAPTSGIAITVAAESPEGVSRLPEAANQVAEAVRQVKGTANVSTDVAGGQPSVEIRVKGDAAAAAGVSPSQISEALRNLSADRTITTAEIDGNSVPVRMQVTSGAATSVETAGALEIAPGVRLGDVAEFVPTVKQTSITRVDGRSAATITGDITDENTGAVTTDVQSAVDGLDLPDGVELTVGGVASDINEAFSGMFVAIGLSVVLVYGIMVVLFRSWLDPLVILFTLPLAVIGALVALFVTGSPLGVSALIGMLMLVGIVVTNAIVMLEFVIMLRSERSYSTYDALVEGARTRLRPILMTAIAAMLALIPLSLGLTEGALIASDLGRVVIGGLFSSTLLTLLVIPVVYSLIDGLRLRFARSDAGAHVPSPGHPVPSDVD